MAKKKPDTTDPNAPPIPAGYSQQFACTFGGFSSGKDTAKIGFSVEKKTLSASQAEKTLCGKRLQVSLDEVIDNELPGATVKKPRIEVTADCKGYRSSRGNITAGLTFALSEINGGEMMKLANKGGIIALKVLGDAGAQSDNSTADDEADDENL